MSTGGSFKSITENDIEIRSSTLNQLVDVIQEDVHGSATRRKYQVFVTGGVGPGVTSSLFQTVYDQDFSLQTANPIFDMTVGLFVGSSLVTTPTTSGGSLVGVSATTGKRLFTSQSLMMREKIDIYRQYAANLLGDANGSFFAPFGNSSAENRIEEALFVSFKRLFARDKIKRETFAMRLLRSGVITGTPQLNGFAADVNWSDTDTSESGGWIDWPEGEIPLNGVTLTLENIDVLSTSGSAIFTDLGAASNILNPSSPFGGEVGNIVNANNTDEVVGLMFYELGTAVLDMKKVFWMDQYMEGMIDAMNETSPNQGVTTLNDSFYHFLSSGSVDQIVDHIASCRFGNQAQTAFTFQNVTNINSTLIFCRATADEFNYSTNPTFTDNNGRIRVIDPSQEDYQRSFAFITTVGLHDEAGNLLAVAKLSRPIEKNDEKDLTVRVRLDF
jgi:hypothetical protein